MYYYYQREDYIVYNYIDNLVKQKPCTTKVKQRKKVIICIKKKKKNNRKPVKEKSLSKNQTINTKKSGKE